MINFNDHISTKMVQYKQGAGFGLVLMAQQALQNAGHNHRVAELSPEQVVIVDAELERRMGGKRVNGKRVSA